MSGLAYRDMTGLGQKQISVDHKLPSPPRFSLDFLGILMLSLMTFIFF